MPDNCPSQGTILSGSLHSPQPLALVAPTPSRETVVLPRQTDSDEQLIALWLHGKSIHTQRWYRAAAERLLAHVNKPLQRVTLGDLQSFADMLAIQSISVATQNRILSATKSLLSFGQRIGYLPFNVGRVLHLPPVPDSLAARILSEGDVQRILALELHPRNRALLTLMYGGALRVSEICSLKWSSLQPRADGEGQVIVFGKGGKTRVVLLPAAVYGVLVALRNGAPDAAPIFRSRKRGHLSAVQAFRIARRAARRAGIALNVSPHWFRHAHASHALDRGAPISLVQATLGHSSISTTGKYLHAQPRESSARYLPL